MQATVLQESPVQDTTSIDDLLTGILESDNQDQSTEQESAADTDEEVESQVPFSIEDVPLSSNGTDESVATNSTESSLQVAEESSVGSTSSSGPPVPNIEEPVETPEAPPITEPPINTENPAALVNSLEGLPATSFVAGMNQVGQMASLVQENEQQTLQSSLPEIEQPTGLPTLDSAEVPAYTPVSGGVPNLETSGEGQYTPIAEEHELDVDPQSRQTAPNIPEPQDTEEEEESWWSRMINYVSRQLNSLNATSGVNTRIDESERASVDTSGEANPVQNNESQTEANETIQQEQQNADLNTTEYRGEQEIYPDMEREMLSPNVELSEPPGRESGELHELSSLTPEVQAAIDAEAQSQIETEVQPEIERNASEYETYQEESIAERANADEEIVSETERVRSEQETAQSQAQEEVNSERQNWSTENQQRSQDYADSSDEQRQQIDSDIETEIQTTEENIETEYSNAETEAERQRVESEQEAARERAEAERERENQGFWGRLRGGISRFFDGLRNAINFIFDTLKDAVRGLIELAKRAVNTLIDLARDAIIGFIEAFGEGLKALVTIALAAFPEIRDRVLLAIDIAVNIAVTVVNVLAEGLKEIANALLDALGAVLDFILSAYQAIYNAIIDVLEFVAVGLTEIIEFLGNLIEGQWNAMGEFLGALATEAIGGNPAEPLPNFEVPTGQERQWASAMGLATEESPEQNIPDNENMNFNEDIAETITEQVNQLLTQPELSDNDVALEPFPAVEMGETLMSQLADLEEGETYELGGAGADAVTTEEFQSNVAADMGIDLDIPNEGDVEALNDSVEMEEPLAEATEPPGQPEQDWRNMSDDAKLDHYLAQMLVENNESAQQQPSPTQEQPEVSTDVSPEALITKTGRLGVGTRLAFMGEQMLTGIQMLWNNYKAWIIGGLITALLAAGIIAFFTGGAGLVAVVQFIGTALILIFGAIAVGRAMGSVWDYITAAWDKDPQQAGKDLAKAFAIIIVEFFIEKILIGMGKVFKRILSASKKAIASTRIGRRAFAGVAQTRRVVNRGVSAVRRTVGRGVTRIRNNKLVVHLGNKIGGGVRRFSRLRDDILDRFRFRRIWGEKHGRYIELWGEFNAKVLLMKEDAQGNREFRIENRPDAGNVGSRTHDGGFVLDDTGNLFSRNTEALENAGFQGDLQRTFDDLDAMTTDADRLQRIQSGNPRVASRTAWDDHQTAVAEEVARLYPTSAQQVHLDIFDNQGNLVTTIIPDNVAIVNGNFRIIDAKHQINGAYAASGSIPSSALTPNQATGIPLIQSGNFGSIRPRGRGAGRLGIQGQTISPSRFDRTVSVITNDISGNLVTMNI